MKKDMRELSSVMAVIITEVLVTQVYLSTLIKLYPYDMCSLLYVIILQYF